MPGNWHVRSFGGVSYPVQQLKNKMKKILLCIFPLILFTCKKEEPTLVPQGNYYTTTIIENSPIRGFNKNGEIKDINIINQILSDYNDYVPSSWGGAETFTNVDFYDDTIVIFPSYAKIKAFNEIFTYDYILNDHLISLESQDTIRLAVKYSDYQKQLFNALSIYSLPSYEEEFVPTTTGYTTITKYLDKKYIHIIDEKTIRVPFTRYLYRIDFTTGTYIHFWILQRQLNNSFNDDGYGIIDEDDVILVKEYEVEYKKK